MNDRDISSDVEQETVDQNLIQQTIERAQGLRRTAAGADELVRTAEAVHVQLGQLARDCQWLLDHYKERRK
ncbi:hypothetical protein [Streptomyces lydicus]|uniref:hypothetical protein n=1 Tax=Streptomyces lydicus TaxID=47763 RepID=UPI0037AB3115